MRKLSKLSFHTLKPNLFYLGKNAFKMLRKDLASLDIIQLGKRPVCFPCS